MAKILGIFTSPPSWSLLLNKAYVMKWSIWLTPLPPQLSTWFMRLSFHRNFWLNESLQHFSVWSGSLGCYQSKLCLLAVLLCALDQAGANCISIRLNMHHTSFNWVGSLWLGFNIRITIKKSKRSPCFLYNSFER